MTFNYTIDKCIGSDLMSSRLGGQYTLTIVVISANFFRWQSSTTEELLPGDLFSLRRSKRNDIVPCDCLLVRGSAVLNEATLTGESVPQMKEGVALSKDGGNEVRFYAGWGWVLVSWPQLVLVLTVAIISRTMLLYGCWLDVQYLDMFTYITIVD